MKTHYNIENVIDIEIEYQYLKEQLI